MTGFEKFLNYHASKLVDAVPKLTDKVQLSKRGAQFEAQSRVGSV